jgi:hypothetical protein
MKRLLVCSVFYLILVAACAPSESSIGTAVAQTLDAQANVESSIGTAIAQTSDAQANVVSFIGTAVAKTLDAQAIPSDMPTRLPSKTPTTSPSITPTVSVTYIATHVGQYPGFTVYWRRELWESAIEAETLIEDFENDEGDCGALSYPYVTGNGLTLEGDSTAQIIPGGNLLPSGNVLHFSDWESGLKFNFPNNTRVRAFGFDFKPTEDWALQFNLSVVLIPGGRRGFIGIVIEEEFPNEFVLSSSERVQGGLTVDNISYLPIDAP